MTQKLAIVRDLRFEFINDVLKTSKVVPLSSKSESFNASYLLVTVVIYNIKILALFLRAIKSSQSGKRSLKLPQANKEKLQAKVLADLPFRVKNP